MVNKGIQIRNIFYMLAYAFRALEKDCFKNVEVESFENADDLLAQLLYLSISYQIKQGLKRDYNEEADELLTVKGKININETFKNVTKNKLSIVCDFDTFSDNILLNRIVKSTVFKLIRLDTISKDRKDNLKSLLPYFIFVDYIEFSDISWNSIEFDRNNQNYILILNLCKIVASNVIMSEREGNKKYTIFTDKQLNLVFQNFVLNYYKEFIKKNNIANCNASPSKIERAIDYTKFNEGTAFLPELQTDIKVEYNNKTLIIDTKFYEKIMVEHFGIETYHSNNIYQIHEYVNQYSFSNTDKNVSGLLLYAKTDEETQPNMTNTEMGHQFYIRTIDLNVEPFSELSKQLDNYLNEMLFN